MFNLISSDIYRLVKTKSTYIILIITMALIAVQAYTISQIFINMSEDMSEVMEEFGITETGEYVQETEDENGDTEIVIGDDSADMQVEVRMLREKKAPFNDLLVSCMSTILTLMISIFAVVFCSAEFKNGYVKNLAGSIKRYKLVISKFVCVALYTAILFALSAAIIFVICKIRLEVQNDILKITSGNAAGLFKAFGFEFLGNIAMAAVVIAVVEVTRSRSASMAIAVVLSSGLTSAVYQLVTLLLQKKFGVSEDFYLGNYVPSAIVEQFRSGLEQSVYNRMLAVGLIFTALSLIVSAVAMQKKDI